MTALFVAGHVVNMALHCGACGLDTVRNGICTDPSCEGKR